MFYFVKIVKVMITVIAGFNTGLIVASGAYFRSLIPIGFWVIIMLSINYFLKLTGQLKEGEGNK